MQTHSSIVFQSPIGRILISANAHGLTGLDFSLRQPTLSLYRRTLEKACKQLEDYFSGNLRSFDLPLAFEGTDFQKEVWNTLLTIPYGETRTYLEIAKAVGRPKACRAVGNAVGKNPLPVIVPCHRVIAEGGKMGGFSCGIEKKHYLLNLESRFWMTVKPSFEASVLSSYI